MTGDGQLVFDLPRRVAAGLGDFFVSPSNADAMARIEGWTAWPDAKLLLVGPEGSGKTHLARVWAEMAGAVLTDARGIADLDPAAEMAGLVIDDAQDCAGDPRREEALFHLFNATRAAAVPVLICARSQPARWPLALPDLASRMASLDVVKLSPPDDLLLSVIMVKLFSDRQLNVRPDVVKFLVRRTDRSFSAVAEMVDRLDRAALRAGKAITIPFVKETLNWR